jgi:hypothetical protein
MTIAIAGLALALIAAIGSLRRAWVTIGELRTECATRADAHDRLAGKVKRLTDRADGTDEAIIRHRERADDTRRMVVVIAADLGASIHKDDDGDDVIRVRQRTSVWGDGISPAPRYSVPEIRNLAWRVENVANVAQVDALEAAVARLDRRTDHRISDAFRLTNKHAKALDTRIDRIEDEQSAMNRWTAEHAIRTGRRFDALAAFVGGEIVETEHGGKPSTFAVGRRKSAKSKSASEAMADVAKSMMQMGGVIAPKAKGGKR